MGRARSLTAASVVGFVGVLALLALALRAGSVWIGIMAAFVAMNCWQGFQHSRALSRLASLPRRPGYSCPSCGSAPLLGALWGCGGCGAPFDTFETGARCPSCRAVFGETRCADCGRSSPIVEWLKRAACYKPAILRRPSRAAMRRSEATHHERAEEGHVRHA